MLNREDSPDDFDAKEWFLAGHPTVKEITGDIFVHAHEHCDACVLWLSRGSGELLTFWREFVTRLEARPTPLKQLRHDQWHRFASSLGGLDIWLLNPLGTLLRFEPVAGGRLKLVYVLPNLRNDVWLEDYQERLLLILSALDAMNNAQAKAVAMNRIPGSDPYGENPVQDNIYEALEEWEATLTARKQRRFIEEICIVEGQI